MLIKNHYLHLTFKLIIWIWTIQQEIMRENFFLNQGEITAEVHI